MDELCAALARLGHEIILVGPARTARLQFGGDAGVVGFLKRTLPRAIYEMLELAYNLIALPRLWLAIRRHRPDAVYERYNLFAISGAILARLNHVPLLIEVNAPLCEERAKVDGIGLKRVAAWSEKMVWRSADYVLPVTHVLADYVRRAGVDERRIIVVPNGIDERKFAELPRRDVAKRRLGLDGRMVLGFTGFVRAWNSLERVIDFMAGPESDPTIHLLLVGDGPARAELEARAQRLGVRDRLTVTGIVAREAIVSHIAAFDIALQPGVTPYASPLKLFEYMAAGLAIIAPDSMNIREILTNGADAVLVDPDSPEQLAAAIGSLSRDEARREKLGAAARATIERRGFTWTKNAQLVAELVLRLRGKTSALDRGPADHFESADVSALLEPSAVSTPSHAPSSRSPEPECRRS